MAHCTVTRGRVRNVKHVGFEPGPEDSYGRCGRAEVTRSGRLSQTRAAATGKEKLGHRRYRVDRRVRLTVSDEDELERSRWRASTSATWQSSSIRYAGATPTCSTKYAEVLNFSLTDKLRWAFSSACVTLQREKSGLCRYWHREWLWLIARYMS